MNSATILLAGLVMDAVFGEPKWLWSRIAHPVAIMGKIIAWAEDKLYRDRYRRIAGILFLTATSAAVFGFGLLISAMPGSWIVEILAVATFLAHKSLVEHVKGVAEGLRQGTGQGREAVAKIVGRDVAELDDTEVARAAIESAAENFSDGVVAPGFWFLLLGLPGLLAYKFVNTADSMIGYKNQRYREFGWAAARLDDLLNAVPSRLTCIIFLLLHGSLREFRRLHRDASLHSSPNAGWPEAAMAIVLGVALAGPRSYDGAKHEFAYVNPGGRKDIWADDIEASVRILWRSWIAVCILILAFAVVW